MGGDQPPHALGIARLQLRRKTCGKPLALFMDCFLILCGNPPGTILRGDRPGMLLGGDLSGTVFGGNPRGMLLGGDLSGTILRSNIVKPLLPHPSSIPRSPLCRHVPISQSAVHIAVLQGDPCSGFGVKRAFRTGKTRDGLPVSVLAALVLTIHQGLGETRESLRKSSGETGHYAATFM